MTEALPTKFALEWFVQRWAIAFASLFGKIFKRKPAIDIIWELCNNNRIRGFDYSRTRNWVKNLNKGGK